MNIGSISSQFTSLQAELRPAELATVGRESLAEDFASERPVPSIEKSSRTGSVHNALNSEKHALPATYDFGNGSELEANATDSSESNQASADPDKASEKAIEEAQLAQDQALISELSARDREVRAHEQAHAAVGGQYAGGPQYQFERGPDGVSYAVGGEVSIDVSKAGTPQETIQKMQVVRRAALAPAEPSPQDRRVASQASLSEAQARKELAALVASDELEPGEKTELEEAESSVSASNSSRGAGSQDLNVPSGLPPTAISHQLNQSILSTQLSSRTGSLFDQHA